MRRVPDLPFLVALLFAATLAAAQQPAPDPLTRLGWLAEFEQIRLQTDGERIVYTPRPSGQREVSFTSSEITDSSFTVENPAHDFPQRIIYRRRGPDSLIARVEGGGRGVDFAYRRRRCTAP